MRGRGVAHRPQPATPTPKIILSRGGNAAAQIMYGTMEPYPSSLREPRGGTSFRLTQSWFRARLSGMIENLFSELREMDPILLGPGIYFLIGKDDGVLYVGQSVCLINRLSQHVIMRNRGEIDFVGVRLFICEERLLNHWEGIFIVHFKPPLNGNAGPKSIPSNLLKHTESVSIRDVIRKMPLINIDNPAPKPHCTQIKNIRIIDEFCVSGMDFEDLESFA